MKTSSTTRKLKTMRGGFMCQSPGSTAVVCMTVDPRSIIVPRRTTADRSNITSSSSSSSALDHHARLINCSSSDSNSNHSPLVDSRSCRSFNRITTTTLGDHQLQIQPINPSSSQVVVMRVSLHCQGCAGKLKKHLSKMEGVTSFSIDLETKRVTVMGNVSPVGVLESISKVKKAEFWNLEEY